MLTPAQIIRSVKREADYKRDADYAAPCWEHGNTYLESDRLRRDELRAIRLAIADAERVINAAWALDIDTAALRRARNQALDTLAELGG